MKKGYIAIICIIALSFLIGIYLFQYMPERMASHWDIRGAVDGYTSRFWALFLMPIMSIVLLALFLAIPMIDPLSENIEKFRGYYDSFVVMIIAFMFYIHLLTLFWNLGREFNMQSFMAPAFGILFFYCGVLISNTKRNWSIGIRTPWTLSNDKVWNETHELGGKLFKLTGLICAFGMFFPQYAIIFVTVPALISVVLSLASSYFFYHKVNKFRSMKMLKK
jgi:uncharacterized membrane protein